MKIHVGSQNNIKIKAVGEAVAQYPKLFPKPQVWGIDVNVPLFGHPKSLKESVEGAITRAKSAFTDCDYSFGLEGGLMEVPHTHSGFMEVSVCAVYDGKEIYLGLSPAFEWPKTMTNSILTGEEDGSTAFKRLGFTNLQKLGSVGGGGIGLITDNKLTRGDCIKYSIMTALVHLEKPEMYKL